MNIDTKISLISLCGLLTSGCATIHDMSYDRYREVEFVDQSQSKGAWVCVSDEKSDSKIQCSDLMPFVEYVLERSGQIDRHDQPSEESIKFSTDGSGSDVEIEHL